MSDGVILGTKAIEQVRELIRREANRVSRPEKPQGRRHVIQSQSILLGKTDEAIAKGATGTVSQYDGDTGTETDTGENFECKNKFADVDTGKWVAFTRIGNAYYLIAAECD